MQGGISVDLTRMDAVVEVHEEDFYATVEPGVTRTALNSYIRDTGLWFPIGIQCYVTFLCSVLPSITEGILAQYTFQCRFFLTLSHYIL